MNAINDWLNDDLYFSDWFRLKHVAISNRQEDAIAIPDVVDVPGQQEQQEEEGRSSKGQPFLNHS